MSTPSTGVLKAREGCVAVAQAFEKKGGRFVTAKAELGRRSGGTLQDVALSTGQTLSAQTFVFACGPWLPKVFPTVMGTSCSTPRRVVFFYGTPPGDERFTYPNFPAWSVDNAYGFPSIEGKGLQGRPDDRSCAGRSRHAGAHADGGRTTQGPGVRDEVVSCARSSRWSKARSASAKTASTSTSSSARIRSWATSGWSAADRATATNTASCWATTSPTAWSARTRIRSLPRRSR